jgi:hypothetical protein
VKGPTEYGGVKVSPLKYGGVKGPLSVLKATNAVIKKMTGSTRRIFFI